MVWELSDRRVGRRDSLVASVFAIATVLLGFGILGGTVATAAPGGPAIVAVAIRGPSQTNILDITASVKSGLSLDYVNLSYSTGPDVPFGAPVLMNFATYNSATGVYNYTYQLSWSATEIRLQIVAVDKNGVQSQPFLSDLSWHQQTVMANQSLFGGVVLGFVIAVLVAVVSLVAAFVLRRLLRGRTP